MKIAAEGAARYAVGPLGLAALAVSAAIALRPTHHEAPAPAGVMINDSLDEAPPFRVRVDEVLVEGSPDADAIAARIRDLDFSQCGWRSSTCGVERPLRETLYVHIRDGAVITDGDYEVTCLMAVVESGAYVGDADVMLSLELERKMELSR
jgi:hypothetical protein